MRNYEERNYEAGIAPSLLQALRDCSTTTRMGLIDKGSPRKLQQLAMLRLVAQKNDGYVVTEEGWIYLSEHKRELLKL